MFNKSFYLGFVIGALGIALAFVLVGHNQSSVQVRESGLVGDQIGFSNCAIGGGEVSGTVPPRTCVIDGVTYLEALQGEIIEEDPFENFESLSEREQIELIQALDNVTPEEFLSGGEVFENVTNFEVGPEMLECSLTESGMCLEVNGEAFGDTIQGFEFTPGSRYVIDVEKSTDEEGNDTYRLIGILSIEEQ